MGIFDRFRQKPTEPPQRVLASLHKSDGKVQLMLGRRALVLDSLPKHRLEWLSRLSTPILVEADVVTVGEEKHVTALGSVQPHPRIAALRAVEDSRFGSALDSLEVLGEAVEIDLELLSARMKAYVGVGRFAEAEADFERISGHPDAKPSDVSRAFEALPAVSTEKCSSLAVSRVVALAASDPAVSLRRLLARVPMRFWTPEALLRGLDEVLSAKVIERWDLEDAKKYLAGAQSNAPAAPRTVEAAQRLAKATARIAAREKKKAAALSASRPDFAEVESIFSAQLPKHLRQAWESHYEGKTVGFGFFPAHKDHLEKLTDLTRRLEKDLPDELRRPLEGRSHQVLPFAVGEHEEEYFALDLTQPTTDGDYAVLVLFLGQGEGWVAYPHSAAWIAGDGVTHYA